MDGWGVVGRYADDLNPGCLFVVDESSVQPQLMIRFKSSACNLSLSMCLSLGIRFLNFFVVVPCWRVTMMAIADDDSGNNNRQR